MKIEQKIKESISTSTPKHPKDKKERKNKSPSKKIAAKGNFEFPDGGWECSKCQNYNFKGRKECNRCKKVRTTKVKLKKQIMTAYWGQNSLSDSSLRKELDLD